MPEALSVYSEQSRENYMNTGAPLVITPGGRRIAYYSDKDQRFAVRDLASGQILLSPQAVTRATLVKEGGVLRISPDGRFLGISGAGWPDAVVDMETGQATEVPQGWVVQQVPEGGTPAIVTRDGRLGLLADGEVKPLTTGTSMLAASQLSPDGHTVAYVGSGTAGNRPTINAHFTPAHHRHNDGRRLGQDRVSRGAEELHAHACRPLVEPHRSDRHLRTRDAR
ncbi:hypothetical protein ABGB18_06465 [Nonomuraea sp. B12E4]|uniref:hypothetical protein n=1 Tax=Nonomuraea sp. B12E4 TaxID=3153564 RepID=UPI00325E8544